MSLSVPSWLLSLMFESQHSKNELSYFLFFLLLMYLAYTFWVEAQIKVKEIEKEQYIVFGKTLYANENTGLQKNIEKVIDGLKKINSSNADGE